MPATIRDAVSSAEFGYPSNILSIVRIVLVGPTVYYLLRPGHGRRALLLLAVGMATDAVDGPLARRRGEVSELGKLLDPIADKLTLDGVAFAMSLRNGFPWWVTGLLLARDAAIVAGAGAIFRHSTEITTSIYAGKLTTAMLSGALLLYGLDAQPWGRRLLEAAMVPLGVSCLQYGQRFLRWRAAR